MQIVNQERATAPLKRATLSLDEKEIETIVGALQAFAGKRSNYVRTTGRRTRALALLMGLGYGLRG